MNDNFRLSDRKADRKASGWCIGPMEECPPPGTVGLDLKAACRCGKRVRVTVRGNYSHHKPTQPVKPNAQSGAYMTREARLERVVGPAQRALDPCCGSRMMWLDRQNPDVVFGDCRREVVTVTDQSHGNAGGTRTLRIEPDVDLDFRALPYPDKTFALVAFDPPHLVRAGPRSWLAAKYGKLGENWRDDLRQGFAECLRVLRDDGVLVFKWNETQVPVREVLALAPIAPMFGHLSGRKGLTHWLVFMRPNAEIQERRSEAKPSPGISCCAAKEE